MGRRGGGGGEEGIVWWMDFEGCSESATRPRNLLMLLKSSFLTLFRGVGRGARGFQRPAVCPSLSAVCWVGDELGMSDGLPVWAERLWVAAGLPQGWPDGCYAPHWPGVRCRGFMRICYTHANHTKKTHTQPADVHTHTYIHMWERTLEAGWEEVSRCTHGWREVWEEKSGKWKNWSWICDIWWL